MIFYSERKYRRINTGRYEEVPFHSVMRDLYYQTGEDTKLMNECSETHSIVLTLFYITYSIFEVPSNYYLKRVGPSVCIALL